MTTRRKATAILAGGCLVVLSAGVAEAVWSVSGSGAGTAKASQLSAPTNVAGNATTKLVTWTASSTAGGAPTPTGYVVERSLSSDSPRVWTQACTTNGATQCTDTATVPSAAGTYTYVFRVRATYQNWTANSAESGTVGYVVAPTVVTHSFTVSAATSTPTAGTPFNVTIVAKANGVTDATYTGNKTLDWSGGQTVGSFAPSYPTNPVSFTGGSATVAVTLYKAGSQTLSAADRNDSTYAGSTPPLTVAAANGVLSFGACTNGAKTVVKNTKFDTTVTRTTQDPYGNTIGTPAITVTLSPYDATASSHNFTVQSVALGSGVLTSGVANYETSNGNGNSVITGTANGYVSASCTVTTTNS